MKKNAYKWIIAAYLFCTCGTYSGCEEADEVPPRPEKSSSNKAYKMPEPIVLSTEEYAIVNLIREEYNENVTQ